MGIFGFKLDPYQGPFAELKLKKIATSSHFSKNLLFDWPIEFFTIPKVPFCELGSGQEKGVISQGDLNSFDEDIPAAVHKKTGLMKIEDYTVFMDTNQS